MPPKLVAVIAAAALTTGWLLASVVSPPVAELQGLAERAEQQESPRASAVATPFTEQLQLKLRRAPAPPVPRRNPFLFGDSPRQDASREATRAADEPASLTERSAEAIDPTPRLKLSGIGSTTTDAGIERTAVISDGVTVHLAKPGDTIMGYTIVSITEDVVTIEDTAGMQWTLSFQ
jgi:type II secretory pathway component HofQ